MADVMLIEYTYFLPSIGIITGGCYQQSQGVTMGRGLEMNTHFFDLVSPGPAVSSYYQSEFFVHTTHTAHTCTYRALGGRERLGVKK